MAETKTRFSDTVNELVTGTTKFLTEQAATTNGFANVTGAEIFAYINSNIILHAIATIGTGGTYTTFKFFAENTSGHTFGILLSNVTEASDSKLQGSRQIINPNNFILTFGSQYCNLNGKKLIFDSVNLAFANNSGLFDFATDFSQVYFTGYCSIVNSSTAINNSLVRNDLLLSNSRLIRFDYLKITCPNYANCGLSWYGLSTSSCNIIGIYLEIIGGGANCTNILGSTVCSVSSASINIFVNTISLSGTFTSIQEGNTLSGVKCNVLQGSGVSMWNLYCSSKMTNNSFLTFGITGATTNFIFNQHINTILYPRYVNITDTVTINNSVATISGASASNILLRVVISNSIMTFVHPEMFGQIICYNVFLTSSLATTTNNNNSNFQNTHITGSLTIASEKTKFDGSVSTTTTISGINNVLSGAFTGAISITITGKNTKICNAYLAGALTIDADNVTIENCTIVGTLTISATADKTTIIGCRTTGTIVDNGTNTTLTSNNLI
jgi:hypothetical protein